MADIRTITGRKGDIYSTKLGSASWYFYDRSGSLVSQLFILDDVGDATANANDMLTAGVHCDIKPENVLFDDNFTAKVSDFGLAKLMSREQSHAFTMLRGTRGYLAPEWITNRAVSEKCDVYSYGMVLLEIISGRRNFDPMEDSEKAHFPPFAFKKMEEGDLRSIFDAKLNYDGDDDRMDIAIKVAMWCIQEDFHQRPAMSKVVQMLEGVCDVPHPPTSSRTVSILHETAYKPSSALPSAVQLSQAR
ncbi:G-type lectin S-receptor-like serine/threonine-protein kinase SD2-5 [Triticum dicoccoides]|uniref:G-type lectin S-receptor-like serine/threonine-protein kinase SD2-5 n=1 Tax=Triticum dicoccoides TaxID=85692 RepID=UPI00188E80FC|nr:G-type lectin S-receptor-like serine/threonine-protein kinase SD2-5 [Triticum dicoccoides]